MSITPAHILLVEDSPTDIELTREVLGEARVLNQLHAVTDGERALSYLRGEGEYAGAPRPDFVLLDLNLPRMGGIEVLRAMKADPALCDIPVIVLTTSSDEADVLGAYREQASSFIVKPVDLDQFVRVVKTIEGYWLSIVKLPKAAG
ncbi:MAG: response regulator [Solirubrobacteraceae bacterium]